MNETEHVIQNVMKYGCFVPSTKKNVNQDELTFAFCWEPLWNHPLMVRWLEQEDILADREYIEQALDRKIRERIDEHLRSSQFQLLQPRYSIPHTPLERFANALMSSLDEYEPSISGIPAWIADDLTAWHQWVTESIQFATYKVAFILLEPAHSQSRNWLLLPGLRPIDEPWRFIHADFVWSQNEAEPTWFERKYVAPQRRLIQAITTIATNFPQFPSYQLTHIGFELSDQEAAHWMEVAPTLLKHEDIDIILPLWWEQPNTLRKLYRIISTNESTNESSNLFGWQQLVHYYRDFSISDKLLTEAQLSDLLNTELPFFSIDGQWLRIREQDKNQIKYELTEPNIGKFTIGDMIKQIQIDPFSVSVNNNHRLQSWLELNNNKMNPMLKVTNSDIQIGDTFNGDLRTYQKAGVQWLIAMYELGLGACLADDMGLGKTVQWIAYISYVIKHPLTQRSRANLLLCPTSILGNWQKELARFAPSLRVYAHHGSTRKHGKDLMDVLLSSDIVLTTYATVLRDQDELSIVHWLTMTLDEAQFVKNSNTKLARRIRSFHADHRIAMTGTPIENRLTDLWSISEFINPGYLGSERKFRQVFSKQIEQSHHSGMIHDLNQLMQPFILRRVKTDRNVIQDLPEKNENVSYCSMTVTQSALYEKVLEQLIKQLQNTTGFKRKGLVISAITKLKQICNAPEQLLKRANLDIKHSGKLVRLKELVTNVLERNESCIIFTQYAAMAKLLTPFLSEIFDCEVGMMIGRTLRNERERLVDRFQHAIDGPKVVVLSLKTGGYGLNLTRAHTIIHYDRWWNPASENQATDRAYRIGQTHRVEVWKLVTLGTLEEAIDQLLIKKGQLANGIIGTGEQWLTEYSDQELIKLLSLRQNYMIDQEHG